MPHNSVAVILLAHIIKRAVVAAGLICVVVVADDDSVSSWSVSSTNSPIPVSFCGHSLS